jgi:hypothetical protein
VVPVYTFLTSNPCTGNGVASDLLSLALPSGHFETSKMTNPTEPPVSDPDNVPETLCIGKFNVAVGAAGFATLTFTHVRPKATALLDETRIEEETIVRARIVTSTQNLVALRDTLNSLIKEEPGSPATASGGSRKLN